MKHERENMSAFRAETERGLILSCAWVLSGFMYRKNKAEENRCMAKKQPPVGLGAKR
uniref:Uncharacterized protein n=1 Tax=Candidatus Kentrum sp. TUN TaxID=2126343 RepID=A0A451ALS7_9GAMM|nr:MAG: hypothetical protein BECKTUN1418D_GA0071000_10687 [Candidatus Kentron sp. TUN]VFK58568.1 MAG: hypothetical protein BECKTUN1418F_GA0071002_11475 [Candidatus Kentron sp. TUN]VFK66989.1 MAG: hypothetical protein BECKTUN1418E_GA0071001_11276 [Candidatus Kentron sp. TUN]